MRYIAAVFFFIFYTLWFSNEALSATSPKEHPSSVKAKLTAENFEDSVYHLYTRIGLANYNLSFAVFRYGIIGFQLLKQEGKINNTNVLTIIDFTKASTEKRFYTIDLERAEVLYCSYVSHGKNTGENVATSFSNVMHSNQSSLGFYITGETYVGSKGFSLKLDGVEKGYNDNMRERAVVMHEAEYVSENWIKTYGRLGRSQGCPALPVEISKQVIKTIKDRTPIFAYFNDDQYLRSSVYLNIDRLLTTIEENQQLNTLIPISPSTLE